MKTIRIILAFICGLVCYAIGFAVIGYLVELSISFISFLPPAISRFETGLTASALGANFLALFVFDKICGEIRIPKIVFSIILITIAIIYLIACIVFKEFHLLWYPILSFIINALYLSDVFNK